MKLFISVGGAVTAVDTPTEFTTFVGVTVSSGGVLVPDDGNRLAAVTVASSSNSATVDESMGFARLSGPGLLISPQWIIGNGHGGQDATADAVQITPARIPHGVTTKPGKRITVEGILAGLDTGQLDMIVELEFDQEAGGNIQSLCAEASSATDEVFFALTAVGGVTNFPLQVETGNVLREVWIGFSSDFDEVGAIVSALRITGTALPSGSSLDLTGPSGGGQLTTSMPAGGPPLRKPDINLPLKSGTITLQGGSMGADVGAFMVGAMVIIQS